MDKVQHADTTIHHADGTSTRLKTIGAAHHDLSHAYRDAIAKARGNGNKKLADKLQKQLEKIWTVDTQTLNYICDMQ